MAFKADYKGIGDMLCMPAMQAEMLRRAKAVQARAEATAPVESGDYKASFDSDSGVRKGRSRRAYGRVTNTSPHAFHVEFGAKATPKHRTLGKALDAAK